MYNNFCTECGEYCTTKGPFGELLHPECWEEQDKAIEQYERKVANKLGYDQPR
jgi:hypothetical protein